MKPKTPPPPPRLNSEKGGNALPCQLQGDEGVLNF